MADDFLIKMREKQHTAMVRESIREFTIALGKDLSARFSGGEEARLQVVLWKSVATELDGIADSQWIDLDGFREP